ncbi:MAG: YggS family pyridoxal phosphate-dependent enzyme [Clostridiaceae bacterium]|nr:YggS family pyridoxal phosphate-dependent enzyme [Clostridiaceae bacterium]
MYEEKDSAQYNQILSLMRERNHLFEDTLSEALRLAGRSRDELTVIGVSKFFPPDYAKAAYELGIRNLGENRVQEMLEKIKVLSDEGIYPQWHLIGTLQTNKVKSIIGKTTLIHSVDSLRLLDEVSAKSSSSDVTTDILLQVNVSEESTKHGFSAEELSEAIERSNAASGIRLRGLMTMAPIFVERPSDEADKCFWGLRELFDRHVSTVKCAADWTVLSMGMSQDYASAIRHGATHIRVGTAIFGPRTL